MREVATDKVRDNRLRLLHLFKPAQYTSLANRGMAINPFRSSTSVMPLSILTTS
jgi:hypothetical protein